MSKTKKTKLKLLYIKDYLYQYSDENNPVSADELQEMLLEKEIEWFTLKFDHKNADKPWGTSKDSLERTILKLRGKCI